MNIEMSSFGRMVAISLFAILGAVGTQLSPNGVFPYFQNAQGWTDPMQIKVHLIDIGIIAVVGIISYWLQQSLKRERLEEGD
jgi:hypothetical protein